VIGLTRGRPGATGDGRRWSGATGDGRRWSGAIGLTRGRPGTAARIGVRRSPRSAGQPVAFVDVDVEDPKDIVRRGYDVLSLRYDEASAAETKYRSWIDELTERLPAEASVLDLGCGSGVPVARALATAGHRVVGVDISDVQIRRARERVPQAEFIRADATTVDFPADSFDAVVSFYALIHIPLVEQFPLLAKVARWLRPGGWFVGTTGHHAWTGIDENWLGGGATMWWSHADAATYRAWLTRVGLAVEREEFVPEGDTGHELFWARRPADV
jgi:ubiquinone/menaquinone biosynthesis C-methylase UbiE